MLAVIAHTTADHSIASVDVLVEVTRDRMIVTLALLALVGLSRLGGHPLSVVVERHALLAVSARSEMLTLTLAVYHAAYHPTLVRVVLHALHRYAATGVAVAQAATSHHHLVQGVVVFLGDVGARVEQVIAERVQPSKVDTQVGDFQKVLDLCGVRIT